MVLTNTWSREILISSLKSRINYQIITNITGFCTNGAHNVPVFSKMAGLLGMLRRTQKKKSYKGRMHRVR